MWGFGPAWFAVIHLLSLFPLTACDLSNFTIDDALTTDLGSPVSINYFPAGAWKAASGETVCATCAAHPDVALAHNGTWHEGVYLGNTIRTENPVPSALIAFGGVAVYVYCIVPRSSASPDGHADMLFMLDGEQVGTFVRALDGTGVYDYNVPVYVNESLPATNHTLVISAARSSNANPSLVLLDYVIYSATHGNRRDAVAEPFPSPTTFSPLPSQVPTSTSGNGNSSSGAVSVGRSPTIIAIQVAIGGAIVLTVVVAFAMRFWHSYKRSRLPPSAQYLRSIRVQPGSDAEAQWMAKATSPVGAGTGTSAGASGASRTGDVG